MSGSDASRGAFGTGRVTEQRRVIAGMVTAMPRAFTVEDLADAVRRSDPACGAIATVYRAVSAMEASGFIERVGTRDGAALFVRCEANAHHHHVVCDGCGRIAHADCPLDVATTTADGFVVTRHEVTLYGLCPACAIERRP